VRKREAAVRREGGGRVSGANITPLLRPRLGCYLLEKTHFSKLFDKTIISKRSNQSGAASIFSTTLFIDRSRRMLSTIAN